VLTDAGYEKLKEASRTHHEDIGRMFTDHFSEQELDELSELLGRLVSDPRCMPG
jgi:DNA-binding MarR family transcriptional regulator